MKLIRLRRRTPILTESERKAKRRAYEKDWRMKHPDKVRAYKIKHATRQYKRKKLEIDGRTERSNPVLKREETRTVLNSSYLMHLTTEKAEKKINEILRGERMYVR